MNADAPRFQFHLSTCLVLAFILGIFGTLNSIENFGSVPPWIWIEKFEVGTRSTEYGFPYSFAMVSRHVGKTPQCLIFLDAALINMIVASGALWAAFKICERRRRN